MRLFVNLVLSVCCVFLPAYAGCRRIEVKGTKRTYKVTEIDIVKVIKSRLSQINWQQEEKRARENFWKYRPPNAVILGKARAHHIRYYEPTYILPFDIKDAFGNTIYPAGTQINPLDYIDTSILKSQLIVVFDVKDKDQVKFVKSLLQSTKKKNLTLLANCNANLKDLVKLMKKIKFPIYFIDKSVAERFGVKETLSLIEPVRHNGINVFKIEEIPSKELEGRNEKVKGNFN